LTEQQKCPECGGTYLVRDGETGEVVCRSCGVVVGEAEYAAHSVPAVARGSFAFTSLARTGGKPAPSDVRKLGPDGARLARRIGRLEGTERTEAAVANMINGLADKLGLPKAVEEEAMVYAKRLLKGMREKGKRLKAVEVSAVSLWNALKVQGHPVTMREYLNLVNALLARRDGNGGFKTASFYRLLTKAAEILPPPGKMFAPADYVGRLCARLEGLADRSYIATVEAYAITLCKAAEDELFGKDPVCAAATAICVADEAFGGWMGADKITKTLGVGYSQSTAQLLKKRRPPLPPTLHAPVLKALKMKGLGVLAAERLRNGVPKGGENA
jgi:transcription initiation factor TFIIIB Brf1 subunit/transcription initiation factor TFIIB